MNPQVSLKEPKYLTSGFLSGSFPVQHIHVVCAGTDNRVIPLNVSNYINSLKYEASVQSN